MPDSNLARPTQQRSQLKLEQLMSAATVLMNNRDLEAITVSDIAQAAGVATGTVYQRFKDKEALLGAVVARFSGDMKERVFNRLRQASEDNRAEAIVEALAAAMVSEYRENRGLMKAATRFWSGEGQDSRIGEPVRLMAIDLGNLLLELFSPHLTAFGDAYPERTVSQALQFMFGILMFEAATDAGPLRLDEPYIENELVRMFCRYTGLQTPTR